jgi:hypothetical protein
MPVSPVLFEKIHLFDTCIEGYLHEGGTRLHLIINEKTVCSVDAKYGSNSSSIIETASCPSIISVQKGDTATVTAEYDAIKHPRYKP